MKRYSLPVLLLLLVLLFTLVAIASLYGPAPISARDVLHMIEQAVGINVTTPAPEWIKNIFWYVRLPRVVLALMVGGSLAICGATMQGLFRNPLASPEVLGVSSGASLGAVCAIFFALPSLFSFALPLCAFWGAVVTLFIVYNVASQHGHTPMGSLLLAGVAISALNVALFSLLLSLSLESWEIGRNIIYWSMGGLEGRTWDHVILLSPFFVLGSLCLMMYSRELDALLLGELQATSVGVDVAKTRKIILVVVSFMIGATVAVSGAIGFVGLVVPHMLRLLVGPHHRTLLPLSILGGGIILLGADLLARELLPMKEIPIGVITASFGAPFFLYLLMRERKKLTIVV